jgi:hypothetical protein
MGPAPSKIAFFLTGHGFGHGVRNASLIDSLPPEVEVIIFSSLPESFFREELEHSWRLIPCELDCGTLQKDTVEVDVEGSLACYLSLESRRGEAIGRFSPLLRSLGVDLVIGDAPPLAFPIARAAGVPAWALYNFTWLDIYRPYMDRFPEYLPMLDRMEKDYAQADLRLRIFPALQSPPSGPLEDLGLLCKTGESRREEFARKFSLDPARKWCLVYVGSFGLEGVAWRDLARFTDWEFIGLYPLAGAPSNYKCIRGERGFRYADLTASCDLILGKLGYGLVAGCLSMGKPVLFLGRKDFAEYAMLKALVEERGLGMEVPLEAFLRLDIGEQLRTLSSRRFPLMAATARDRILEKMGFSPSKPV